MLRHIHVVTPNRLGIPSDQIVAQTDRLPDTMIKLSRDESVPSLSGAGRCNALPPLGRYRTRHSDEIDLGGYTTGTHEFQEQLIFAIGDQRMERSNYGSYTRFPIMTNNW